MFEYASINHKPSRLVILSNLDIVIIQNNVCSLRIPGTRHANSFLQSGSQYSRYKCLFTLNLLADCLRHEELTRYKNIFVYLRELNAAVCYEAAALRSGL